MNLRQLVQRTKNAFSSIYSGGGYGIGYGGSYGMGSILEPFAGAWQKNVVCDAPQNLLAFSAVYACISLISNDISKLRIKLIEKVDAGTWEEVTRTSPYSPVLSRPNHYQTRLQFISQWIACKLLHGNAYILKERDQRGIVIRLYVVDPRLVVPKIADDGSVWYALNREVLAGKEAATIPASEIIHDRMVTLWHPLVGVTPIYACGSAATQGIRIQANSARFFENQSRPSGQLTAPGKIEDVTAARLKADFERNFSGANIGRLLVAGDGLKFEGFTIPAADAQLIEQLRWTIEDVARCFLVPQYKIESSQSGRAPAANLSALNQDYYNQTLQTHIEGIELLLNEGLGLDTPGYETEMDLDGLLRMDPLSMADAQEKGVRAGIVAPNEARSKLNLKPVKGGDTPYLQQQNYSLGALDKRDSLADPFASNTPAPAPTPTPAANDPNAQAAANAAGAKTLCDRMLKNIAALPEFDHA